MSYQDIFEIIIMIMIIIIIVQLFANHIFV